MRSISACILLLAFFSAYSQDKSTSLKGVPFKERIVTGGGMGLGFGNTYDFVSVSPVVGYMLTTKLLTGVNLTYRYVNNKQVNPSLSMHDYGFGPFGRYTVYKNIFLQAEYEHLNYQFATARRETFRYSFNSFLAGAGFYQPISEKAGFYLMAMYNFSYKEPGFGQPSAYDRPLILRAGINIGGFSF